MSFAFFVGSRSVLVVLRSRWFRLRVPLVRVRCWFGSLCACGGFVCLICWFAFGVGFGRSMCAVLSVHLFLGSVLCVGRPSRNRGTTNFS